VHGRNNLFSALQEKRRRDCEAVEGAVCIVSTAFNQSWGEQMSASAWDKSRNSVFEAPVFYMISICA
jgi:hypothetical protein